LLRGIERPVTLVPVYLGYEHVMEVSTYVNELQGSGKKKESIGGVLKAIRNLRDYGYGYVNFGEPIQLNQYLSQQVSDWKSHIHPLEVQKPNWLNPLVAKLANQVMQHINQAAALNATNLIALSILATDKHILTRDELAQQLSFYLDLQRHVPYHPNISLPQGDADSLITHALTLQKVQSTSDGFGELIGLNAEHSVLATYYKNNILHLFMLPSLLASSVLHQRSISSEQLLSDIEQLYPLLKAELFLYVSSLRTYCQALLQFMTEQGLIESDGVNYYAPAQQSRHYFMLSLLAHNAEDTLQRYAIVLNLIVAQGPIHRADLENRAHQLAQRLLNLHGIIAPEYYDKGLFATLVNALKEAGISHTNSNNQVCSSLRLQQLTQTVNTLLRNDILQTLQSIMPQHTAP